MAAFVISVVSAVMVGLRLDWLAVGILWFSGMLDAVDGTISRKTGSSSPLGALMDVMFDRMVEIAILMAIIYVQPGGGQAGRRGTVNTAIRPAYHQPRRWVALVLEKKYKGRTTTYRVAAGGI